MLLPFGLFRLLINLSISSYASRGLGFPSVNVPILTFARLSDRLPFSHRFTGILFFILNVSPLLLFGIADASSWRSVFIVKPVVM